GQAAEVAEDRVGGVLLLVEAEEEALDLAPVDPQQVGRPAVALDEVGGQLVERLLIAVDRSVAPRPDAEVALEALPQGMPGGGEGVPRGRVGHAERIVAKSQLACLAPLWPTAGGLKSAVSVCICIRKWPRKDSNLRHAV